MIGHEPYKRDFAWLQFGICYWLKKNSNFFCSCKIINFHLNSARHCVDKAAEFKFESKFEPLQVIWQSLRRLFQKVIEGLNFKRQYQWPSSWGSSPALLVLVGQASTNAGRFLGSSRCGQRQARLKKTCYHSCNTDSIQESTRSQWFVYFLQRLVTFSFHVKWKFWWNWREVVANLSSACQLSL